MRNTIESTRDRAEDFKFPEVRNPLARTTLDFLTKHIAGARERFKTSCDHLILDLRIFSGTNACAFLLATTLCFLAKTRQMRYWLGTWSALLLLGTVLSGWLYTGQNWLWTILANDYMGWSYPGVHLAITFYLILHILPTLEARATAEDH